MREDDPLGAATVEAVESGDGPVRVIMGAGDQRYDGWIPTDQRQLDLADLGILKLA